MVPYSVVLSTRNNRISFFFLFLLVLSIIFVLYIIYSSSCSFCVSIMNCSRVLLLCAALLCLSGAFTHQDVKDTLLQKLSLG